MGRWKKKDDQQHSTTNKGPRVLELGSISYVIGPKEIAALATGCCGPHKCLGEDWLGWGHLSYFVLRLLSDHILNIGPLNP